MTTQNDGIDASHVVILAECLQAIERGQATIESCVAQFPEFPELRDLLQAAQRVQSMPRIPLSEVAKDQIRQQMLSRFEENRISYTPARRLGLPRRLRLGLSFVAVLLFLFIGSAGLVHAAENAIPGDRLYGLKRIVEQVKLSVADIQSRPAILQELAQTRIEELTALSQRGQVLPASDMSDFTNIFNQAIASQTGPDKRQEILDKSIEALNAAQSSGVITDDERRSMLANLQIPTGNNVATPDVISTSIPTNTPTVTVTISPTLTNTVIDAFIPVSADAPTMTNTLAATATLSIKVTATDVPTHKLQPTHKATAVGAGSKGNAGGNGNSNAGGNGNSKGGNSNGNGNAGGNGNGNGNAGGNGNGNDNAGGNGNSKGGNSNGKGNGKH